MKLHLHINKWWTLSGGSGFDKNGTIIFGEDVSSSEHIDNKKKYILILGKGLTRMT